MAHDSSVPAGQPVGQPADASAHDLVFVCGLHRSGTTPLGAALAGHPMVSGLSGTGLKENEGQHVQDVYAPANAYGGAGRFARDPRAHLTEASPEATPAGADRLWQAWAPYWDLDRQFLVEKSPPNVVMTRFLQQEFPNSSFVIVVRHPIIVALSTQKWRRLLNTRWRRLASFRWWNYASMSSLVEHWLTAHQLLQADSEQLRRVFVLRYEDLVADPVSELHRVQEFLGLDTEIPSDVIKPDFSGRYEKLWESMRDGGRRGRRLRSAVIEEFGAEISRWGYDAEDLGLTGDPIPIQDRPRAEGGGSPR